MCTKFEVPSFIHFKDTEMHKIMYLLRQILRFGDKTGQIWLVMTLEENKNTQVRCRSCPPTVGVTTICPSGGCIKPN